MTIATLVKLLDIIQSTLTMKHEEGCFMNMDLLANVRVKYIITSVASDEPGCRMTKDPMFRLRQLD